MKKEGGGGQNGQEVPHLLSNILFVVSPHQVRQEDNSRFSVALEIGMPDQLVEPV